MAPDDVQKLSGVLEAQNGHERLIQRRSTVCGHICGGLLQIDVQCEEWCKKIELVICGFISPLGWENLGVEEFEKGLHRIQCRSDKVTGSKQRTVASLHARSSSIFHMDFLRDSVQ